MRHPTTERLEAHRSGGGWPVRRMMIESHLRGCAECAAVMRELEADEALLDELRKATARVSQEPANDRTRTALSAILGVTGHGSKTPSSG